MKSVFKTANKFIMTLIIGQIILSLFVGPFRVLQIIRTTPKSTCHMNSIKDYVNSLILVSAVSHAVISYDRYLHVSLAHNYKIRMRGFMLNVLVALPWGAALFYVFSIVFGVLVNHAVLILITFILAVSLLINYCMLIKTLDAHQRNSMIAKMSGDARRRRNRKVIGLCICLLLLEFICSSPGFLTVTFGFIFYASGNKWNFWKDNNALAKEISLIFCLLNASVSPLIYLHSHRPFKLYLRRLFRKNMVGLASEDCARAKKKQAQGIVDQRFATRFRQMLYHPKPAAMPLSKDMIEINKIHAEGEKKRIAMETKTKMVAAAAEKKRVAEETKHNKMVAAVLKKKAAVDAKYERKQKVMQAKNNKVSVAEVKNKMVTPETTMSPSRTVTPPWTKDRRCSLKREPTY